MALAATPLRPGARIVKTQRLRDSLVSAPVRTFHSEAWSPAGSLQQLACLDDA